MAAARTLNQYGLNAHLVEKDKRLGGHAVQWACMATDQCRYCGACLSVELADRIGRTAEIQVHLDTRIETLQPNGEGYRATLSGPASLELNVDGIILATGMRPFDAARIESLQYGRHPRVITTADLNRLLQSETLRDLIGQTPDPAIAFIQCVGSRNKQLGNDYCSQVCCKVALRQAGKLRSLMPEARLSIFHIDLQLIGKEIRSQARELMGEVDLLQGVAGEIRVDAENDRLVIVREDPASGARKAYPFDLVVLAVGMRPADDLGKLLGALGLPFDPWGFLSGRTPLPDRLEVAGAGRFPTDIAGSMLQGANAAHRIATALSASAAKKTPGAVAVFGSGREGASVAGALQAAGFGTLLLDAQSVPERSAEGYELISGAQVTGLDGTAGNYTLRYLHEGRAAQRRVMAFVVANGTERRPVATSLPVAHLSDLQKTLEKDRDQIPSRVIFWLDHNGPEDKTNFRSALEMAVDLSDTGHQVTLIMERVLVHDPLGQQLYDRARGQGVRFLRATDAGAVSIARTENGFQVTLQDSTLPDMQLTLDCDLVVASEQVLPGPQMNRIAAMIKESLDREGFAQAANVRLKPVNSRKKGIFYAGSCHEENDATDLEREIRNLICQLDLMDQRPVGADEASVIDEGLCGRCLTCFRTCPHGAVAFVGDRQPRIQAEACVGCGRCVSQCPARAIRQGEQVLENGAPARTVVYACGRSGYLAANLAREAGLIDLNENLAIVRVPCCRSRIGVQELLAPLLAGARRVVVAACHPGNCQSVDTAQKQEPRPNDALINRGLTGQDVSWHTLAANEPLSLNRILKSEAADSGNAEQEDA